MGGIGMAQVRRKSRGNVLTNSERRGRPCPTPRFRVIRSSTYHAALCCLRTASTLKQFAMAQLEAASSVNRPRRPAGADAGNVCPFTMTAKLPHSKSIRRFKIWASRTVAS